MTRHERCGRLLTVVGGVLVLTVATPTSPAQAHEQPEGTGAEWLMADWMLLSFLVFFLAALVVFVVAVRRGAFRNLEAAKYYLLTIEEPDYYTPAWARNDDQTVRLTREDRDVSSVRQ